MRRSAKQLIRPSTLFPCQPLPGSALTLIFRCGPPETLPSRRPRPWPPSPPPPSPPPYGGQCQDCCRPGLLRPAEGCQEEQPVLIEKATDQPNQFSKLVQSSSKSTSSVLHPLSGSISLHRPPSTSIGLHQPPSASISCNLIPPRCHTTKS